MHELRASPCASCPYRRDVPSGIWHQNEYEKLLAYDRDTSEQPISPFLCHAGDRENTLCRGWFETHGMELLAVRLLLVSGRLNLDTIPACVVPCFATAQEAHDHGIQDIEEPSDEAIELIEKLQRASDRMAWGE